MAKIHEENIVITISRLVKGNSTPKSLITNDLVSNLEAVAQELVGENAVVEVSKAD